MTYIAKQYFIIEFSASVLATGPVQFLAFVKAFRLTLSISQVNMKSLASLPEALPLFLRPYCKISQRKGPGLKQPQTKYSCWFSKSALHKSPAGKQWQHRTSWSFCVKRRGRDIPSKAKGKAPSVTPLKSISWSAFWIQRLSLASGYEGVNAQKLEYNVVSTVTFIMWQHKFPCEVTLLLPLDAWDIQLEVWYTGSLWAEKNKKYRQVKERQYVKKKTQPTNHDPKLDW